MKELFGLELEAISQVRNSLIGVNVNSAVRYTNRMVSGFTVLLKQYLSATRPQRDAVVWGAIMNDIQQVAQVLKNEFSGLRSELESPKDPAGIYWLDLELDGHAVTVEWKKGVGFGISASSMEPIYGEKPEETYEAIDDAVGRIRQLLARKEFTRPPVSVMLTELRERLGLPQTHVAERMNVTQASVSKLERRDDMHIRTLARYVATLGGVLELNIRFSDNSETFRICQFEEQVTHSERYISSKRKPVMSPIRSRTKS
jgi:transcriptional regulator with XRE-family HTH domain